MLVLPRKLPPEIRRARLATSARTFSAGRVVMAVAYELNWPLGMGKTD